MKVLVTGGAGYIGSHVVLACLDAGHEAVVIDDLSTGRREAVPQGVPLIVGDVGDGALVAKGLVAHGIGTVIHMAGKVVVPESVTAPLKYYEANTAASQSLIAACVDVGVESFVFSSTAAVYGAPKETPIAEDAPLEPINPYGRSKLMTEWILADAAAAHGFGCLALRYFNVAGADPEGRAGQSTPQATHLIKVASEAAVGLRDKVEIFGQDYETPDGTCIRDYIHVSDLAAAHVAGLRYLAAGGKEPGHELWLRPRLFGARGPGGGRAGQRSAPHHRARSAAPRGSAGAGGRFLAPQERAGLDPRARRARHHDRKRDRLGKDPVGNPQGLTDRTAARKTAQGRPGDARNRRGTARRHPPPRRTKVGFPAKNIILRL